MPQLVNKIMPTTAFCKRAFILFCGLICIQGAAVANDIQALKLENVHARATFAMATTAAVYLTVLNQSDDAVTLLGVSVDTSVARDAQLHTTSMENDMMIMRQITDGIDILPGERIEFKSGSYHVMLTGLVKPLIVGESFQMTLQWAGHPSVPVKVMVGEGNNKAVHHHSH